LNAILLYLHKNLRLLVTIISLGDNKNGKAIKRTEKDTEDKKKISGKI